jgi:hypothetical protein
MVKGIAYSKTLTEQTTLYTLNMNTALMWVFNDSVNGLDTQ